MADNELRVKLYAGLVCPRRSLDYKKLENYFRINNCRIVDNPENATHIIIVTCGFIDRNIEESLTLINTFKKYSAKLIVGGCLFDIDKNILRKHFDGDIFTTKKIDKIDDYFPGFKIKFRDAPDSNFLHDYTEVDRLLGKRSKVIEKLYFDRSELDMFEETFVIRIGEGCNCRCTFCSHRNAIGPYKSKDEAECIKEFKLGYKNGYRIFRITSMDTGRYGLDIKSSLPGLLNKFLAEADDVEFILEDINPLWINKYGEKLIDLAGLKKIRVLQAPVQSGSAGVLKKMRRWADVDKLKKLLLAIKGANPAMIFATEILIGFPTETEDDFLMTMRFLEDTNIDYSYVYPYYENKNMESSKIYPKCSRDVIDKRLDNAIKYFDENKISYSVFLNI